MKVQKYKTMLVPSEQNGLDSPLLSLYVVIYISSKWVQTCYQIRILCSFVVTVALYTHFAQVKLSKENVRQWRTRPCACCFWWFSLSMNIYNFLFWAQPFPSPLVCCLFWTCKHICVHKFPHVSKVTQSVCWIETRELFALQDHRL